MRDFSCRGRLFLCALLVFASSALCSPAGAQEGVPDAESAPRNGLEADANIDADLDQGSSEADHQLTREIRAKVAANLTLSPAARNVEIETRDGVVTLRGAVRSDAEKTYIATVAEVTSGVRRIDNLLEIEPESDGIEPENDEIEPENDEIESGNPAAPANE